MDAGDCARTAKTKVEIVKKPKKIVEKSKAITKKVEESKTEVVRDRFMQRMLESCGCK